MPYEMAPAMRYSVQERTSSPYPCDLRCNHLMAFPSIENTAKNIVGTVQDYSLFAYRGATNLFRPPDLLARLPGAV